MPVITLSDDDFENNEVSIVKILVKAQLAKSNGEAKRLIQQGGVTVDEQKVEAHDMVVSKAALVEGVKIRKGKKVFHKFSI